MTRLAIVTSHPVQYHAPAFRSLAANPSLEVRVFYQWDGQSTKIDPEFGRRVEWDVPLLDGYDSTFVANVAADPGSDRFSGIDNPTILDEIRNWAPDVLLVYGWAFASHLRVLRKFRGKIPILFRGDSTLLDEGSGWRVLARRTLLRWVYGHVDLALYVGTRNRAYYIAHGLDEKQLLWAPHAVDNEHFAAETASREAEAGEWRRRLGIAGDDTVFLFAGKLVLRKDPTLLVRAFVDLRRLNPDRNAHLVFVGDGELSPSLRIAADGRLDVHFLGFQNQQAMPVIYRMGDALVLPSLFGETWGLSINEGMACGRPTIVSDRVGCGIDLVQPGKTGFIFKHGDQISLRDSMAEVLRDRALRTRMGREAAAFINGWSIPVYTRVVAKAAESLAARTNEGSASIAGSEPMTERPMDDRVESARIR